MEIGALRDFFTAVEEESITKVSRGLHITRSALSRQLSQLEKEIGVKLFNRGARKIVTQSAA